MPIANKYDLKEVLEQVVKRLLNKEDKSILKKDGFVILENLNMDNYLTFDIDKCYVATISKKIIKDVMIFYKLVTEKTLERPVVQIVEDNRIFNEGFVGNVFLIVLGLLVVVVGIVVVVGVFK